MVVLFLDCPLRSYARRCCLGQCRVDYIVECTTADQSIEERLLLIELKEVQRELLHSKQYAEAAHASADAASENLRTQRESMHKVLRLPSQAKL